MGRCGPHTYMFHVIFPTSSILLHIFVPFFHAVHPKAMAQPLLPVSIINCTSLLPHLCPFSCIHSKISELPPHTSLQPCSQAGMAISYHAFYCRTNPQCRRLHWQHRQAPWSLLSGPAYPIPSKAVAASLEFCEWACLFLAILMAYLLLWKLSRCYGTCWWALFRNIAHVNWALP